MERKNDASKQSSLHVIGNVFWMLKYIFKHAQMLIWDKAIRIPITVAAAYIEINLTRWILDSVEQGTFHATVLRIVLIFSVIIFGDAVHSFLNILIIPQKQVNLCACMRKDIIQKVGKIDQLNFQNPKFFDDYTLALNEIDNRAVQMLESVAVIVRSWFSFNVITETTKGISSRFALFGVIAACLEVLLGVWSQQMYYRQTVETTADKRKQQYVGRVTYQPEFTSDLKVYPDFKELLTFRYEQATIGVKKTIHKYAKKIIWIDQAQRLFNIVLKKVLPWVFIVWLLFQQKISISEATVLAAASITLPGTLTKFMSNIQKLYTHSFYIEKLRQFLNYKEEIEREDESRSELRYPVNLALNNVSFAYAKDMPPVLNQVSLTVQHGEKIALVGFNGAGKTTLAKLMIRLFDVTKGELTLNGQPIGGYNVRSVRSGIIYISQDFKIYGFTIAENILTHPVRGAEDTEKVIAALKMVGLYEKVSALKNGIDTFVTREFDDEGAYFSGGELQKLALARIYAGEYGFIILDESTSALDPVSEDEILKIIFTVFRDKTIVMISHRLAAIQYVDHVYFMAQGRIEEHGTHRELMKLEGKYAEFYRAQADKYGG